MKLYNKGEKREARKYLRNNSTKAEQYLWSFLKNKKLCGVKFRRQYSVDRYILDFYSIDLRLAIEIDGEIHDDKDTKEYDETRTKFLNLRKIQVVRFSNEEVFSNIESVLKVLTARIETLPPPAPSL